MWLVEPLQPLQCLPLGTYQGESGAMRKLLVPVKSELKWVEKAKGTDLLCKTGACEQEDKDMSLCPFSLVPEPCDFHITFANWVCLEPW